MALDVVDQLVRSSAVDVVVVDSVAGTYSTARMCVDICVVLSEELLSMLRSYISQLFFLLLLFLISPYLIPSHVTFSSPLPITPHPITPHHYLSPSSTC
jgi:recA bacterial DNA recombination protein